jgi:hypothetical protein
VCACVCVCVCVYVCVCVCEREREREGERGVSIRGPSPHALPQTLPHALPDTPHTLPHALPNAPHIIYCIFTTHFTVSLLFLDFFKKKIPLLFLAGLLGGIVFTVAKLNEMQVCSLN